MKKQNAVFGLFLASTLAASVGCGRPATLPLPYEGDNGYNSNTNQINTLPTGTVQGRVIDAINGLGVADVRVEVVGVSPSRYTTTDSSGNFTLSEVPAVKIKLSLDKVGFTYQVSNGDIVIDVLAGNTVTTPDVKLTRDSDAVPNSFVSSFGNLDQPRGLAIDGTSNALYVVSRYEPKFSFGGLIRPWGVKKFNTSGGFEKHFGLEISNFLYLDNPQGLGVDKGGNVLVIDSGKSKVTQYSTSGEYIKPSSNAEDFGGLKTPYDLAVLRTGQMVVSNAGSNEVLLYNVDHTRTKDSLGNVAKPVLSGSTGIKGLAVDAADCIYVVDDGAAAGAVIKKLDPTGKVLLQFGYRGGRGAGYFEKPTDLAVDNRNGDIYVVDSGNNRVQRFNRDGSFLSEFGGMGPANGQFNNPTGIAVDAQGFVYVSDTGNNRVQKFAPSKIAQQN